MRWPQRVRTVRILRISECKWGCALAVFSFNSFRDPLFLKYNLGVRHPRKTSKMSTAGNGRFEPGTWVEKCGEWLVERENPLRAGRIRSCWQDGNRVSIGQVLQRLFSKAARAAARHSTWGSTHCAGCCHAFWNRARQCSLLTGTTCRAAHASLWWDFWGCGDTASWSWKDTTRK